MRVWWKLRSRRAKVRILVLATVALGTAAFLVFTMSMPGRSHRGPLPALDAAGQRRAIELRTDVTALVGDGKGRTQTVERSLDRASKLVEESLREEGYVVTRLPYESDGATVVNLEAETAAAAGGPLASEVVIVGAHYDTAATGGTTAPGGAVRTPWAGGTPPPAPGADDNASGVAAMLAIARALAREKFAPARTLRFVAFVNEEPPHFWRSTMGSLVYARACKARGDRIAAMVSLETLGYYRDERGTQKYPPVVSWFYPDRGDFVAFVGNTSSRSLVRDAIGTFRSNAAFPSEGAAMPGFVTGVGWSDQWSFWEVGYPGVMVTDTAPFRNPNYHQPTDRPDTLDYGRLSRVVEGLVAVVKKLSR